MMLMLGREVVLHVNSVIMLNIQRYEYIIFLMPSTIFYFFLEYANILLLLIGVGRFREFGGLERTYNINKFFKVIMMEAFGMMEEFK